MPQQIINWGSSVTWISFQECAGWETIRNHCYFFPPYHLKVKRGNLKFSKPNSCEQSGAMNADLHLGSEQQPTHSNKEREVQHSQYSGDQNIDALQRNEHCTTSGNLLFYSMWLKIHGSYNSSPRLKIHINNTYIWPLLILSLIRKLFIIKTVLYNGGWNTNLQSLKHPTISMSWIIISQRRTLSLCAGFG